MNTGGVPILDDMARSGGRPQDLSQNQRKLLQRTFNDSLFLFSHYIMQFDQLELPFHSEMCAWIENWGAPGYEREMMQSPRDSLKSSIGTVADSLRQICREPSKPLVIFNETAGNTSQWLQAIRSTVENSHLFQAVYSDLVPRGVSYADRERGITRPHSVKWNDDRLDFEGRRVSETEGSIMGFGVGGASTGHHWPKMKFDDLIGPKHRDSAAEMMQVENWLKTHLELMRPAKGGMCFCICTPWTPRDVYVTMTEQFDYVLYRRHALEDKDGAPDLTGEPVLERYKKAELLKAADRDWSTFMSQSMCLPMPAGEMALLPSHLRWFRIEDDTLWIEPQFARPGMPNSVPLHKLRKVIILDPAPTEASEIKQAPHSRNGIIILGVDPWGRKFVLESLAVRRPLPGLVDLLFHLAKKWQCGQVYIEEVNFSVSYRHWILLMQQPGQKWSGVRLQPVKMHPGKKDKNKRILDMTPGWRDGHFYLNREGCGPVHMEYLTFHPAADERDCLDALAYHYYVQAPQSDESARLQKIRERKQRAEVCRITGY